VPVRCNGQNNANGLNEHKPNFQIIYGTNIVDEKA
jgi:hypothetical protein